MKRLSKKQRTALRVLKANTFNEGFIMGYNMGKRIAQQEQSAASASGVPSASRNELDKSHPISDGERRCVECHAKIPPYLNHFCEECWRGLLDPLVPEE